MLNQTLCHNVTYSQLLLVAAARKHRGHAKHSIQIWNRCDQPSPASMGVPYLFTYHDQGSA